LTPNPRVSSNLRKKVDVAVFVALVVR